jgi:hypothetical protein
MKLTKTDLKKILKECLIEIFQENPAMLVVSEGRSQVTRKKVNGNLIKEIPTTNTTTANRPIAEDNNDNNLSSSSRINNPSLRESVDLITRQLSQGSSSNSDLIRRALEDTALTTLQNQLGGPSGMSLAEGGTGNASPEILAQEQQELKALAVDGDLGRWAKIALATSKR